jgi:UDP-N-acetylglucosamine/UDP-N-acetylgalactosamine diphosphorylase
VVAGGQGSRLGFDGPKGAFPVGPVSNKTLFQVHAEKIKKYSEKYGVTVPWLIMTSPANHQPTVDFLKEHGWFGLMEDSVHLFPQRMIPSLDTGGKLILADRHSIFKNPDGHGGSLTALRQSGVLEKMIEQGIEIISYFQVDNPLVNIVDPYFIGFHVLQNAHISSKALMKAYPEEKVGVFVEFENGKIGVVEYSDLPGDKQYEKDDEGNLRYAAGSIAIHLFGCSFLMDITGGGKLSLPFHIAKKKISEYTEKGEKEIQGFKFEKFVFDALPLTDKNFIMETTREEEFAPVKNKSGVDSVESARELMSNLAMDWLKQKGISIPPDVKVVEISPLQAVEPEDIDDNITIPAEEEVYIQ